MTPSVTAEIARHAEPSLAKQRLYSSYAKGEISRQELAEAVAKIQPPVADLSWKYRLAALILTAIANAFIPPSARRND
jgi:hypothetical protein